MLNEALKDFKEFPKNFLEWISEFSCSVPPEYTIQEAKSIYKNNCHKEFGFIYRTYVTKSVSMDNAWYDSTDFLSQINVELSSVGKPKVFFGSRDEYKSLLSNLLTAPSNTKIAYHYLKQFHQFGKIYIFESSIIKNPMEIF